MDMKIPTGCTGFILVLLALTTPFGNDSGNHIGTAFAAESFVNTTNIPAGVLTPEWDNSSGGSDAVSGGNVTQPINVTEPELNLTEDIFSIYQNFPRTNVTGNWYYENPKKNPFGKFDNGFDFGMFNYTDHSDVDFPEIVPSVENDDAKPVVETPSPDPHILVTKSGREVVVPRTAPVQQDEKTEIESLRNFDSCVRIVDNVAVIGVGANGHKLEPQALPDSVLSQ